MTRLLLKAPQAHNVSQLPYFPVIANKWNECGDPDKNQKKEMHIILDCFAITRNDEAAFKSPSGSQCEPAPLAGSKIYNNLFSPLIGGDIRRTEGVGY